MTLAIMANYLGSMEGAYLTHVITFDLFRTNPTSMATNVMDVRRGVKSTSHADDWGCSSVNYP